MRQSSAGRSPRTATSHRAARFKSQVVAVLAAIPEGRVTTYGAIGRHLRATARQVARILATLTTEESQRLPWFRVVAANGVVSSTKLGAVGRKQIKLLRAEGVAVTPQSKCEDFMVIAWSPAGMTVEQGKAYQAPAGLSYPAR